MPSKNVVTAPTATLRPPTPSQRTCAHVVLWTRKHRRLPLVKICKSVKIFLIAKRIAAGPLMDLAAALLDALELHYDLFLDENELAMAPQINRFEDDTVSGAHDDSAPQTKDAELEAAIEDVPRRSLARRRHIRAI